MSVVFHQRRAAARAADPPLADTMTPLDDYRLISISGPDRIPFLQGQLTLDLRLLAPGQWALGGWAEPSGRLLMVARVICTDDAILLLVPVELLEGLLRRLQMYVLRAKAVISEDRQRAAWALTPGAALPAGLTPLSGPDAGQFQLALGTGPDGNRSSQPDPAWMLANIRAGIGEVRSATSGEFLPQMLNLDLLGAIGFDKGCYVGQEIVARTHYRGRLKRRMFRLACVLPDMAPLAAPGTRVVNAAGTTVGQVVCAAPADATHGELLAVVQLDAIGQALFLEQAGGTPLQRLDLPYPVPVMPAED